MEVYAARMTVRSLRQWERWQAGAAIAGLLSALAYVGQIEVGRKLPFWAHLLITLFGATCTAIAILLPVREQRKQALLTEEAKSLAEREATIVRTGLQDFLSLVASLLVEIVGVSDVEEREKKKERLKQLVVALLGDKVGPERTRASFFTYKDNPSRRLVCENIWHGRDQGPKTEFAQGTDRGDYMLTKVDARESLFVRDVRDEKVPGWDYKGWEGERSYETFIATPVAVGDRIFGMLCLDGPTAGDLSDLDEASVRLFAHLLAAGLGM